MDKDLVKAIAKTKEYGRKYGVEYTEADVEERLISKKIFPNFKCQISNVKNKVYEKKMDLARELSEKICFESILMIGVTGSVAAGYPKENSDIDLMIITKKDSLWLTRLILRIYIWWRKIPHRKYGQDEQANEFCFNLWMEEDSLVLPKSRRNLKNAMDLILMKPVFNRNQTYERFLKVNSWAKEYVATGYSRLIANYQLQTTNNKTNWFGPLINWVVFWPQRWYMRRKIGGGLVNKKMAFFHPKDI